MIRKYLSHLLTNKVIYDILRRVEHQWVIIELIIYNEADGDNDNDNEDDHHLIFYMNKIDIVIDYVVVRMFICD